MKYGVIIDPNNGQLIDVIEDGGDLSFSIFIPPWIRKEVSKEEYDEAKKFVVEREKKWWALLKKTSIRKA
jgi:hypothetical protein